MGNEQQRCYLEREDFLQYVEKLNALYSGFSQWQTAKANKDHIDLFGASVEDGELYYRMDINGNFRNSIELSKNSMDKLIFLLFRPNSYLEEISDSILEKRDNNLIETINKLRLI